ncbi:MAG: BrnA antitoxin family protein [Caldilineaceae bacterium]|nr:BrnA antitoxin family protein [Caldilineaceae bacterium]
MKSDKFKDKSFEEISGEYGEEAAINAGIEADPETMELDEEWFTKARPASEVVPDIVERYLRLQGRELEGTKIMLSIPLDADLAQYIRGLGPEWEEVVNDKLRRAFFST